MKQLHSFSRTLAAGLAGLLALQEQRQIAQRKDQEIQSLQLRLADLEEVVGRLAKQTSR